MTQIKFEKIAEVKVIHKEKPDQMDAEIQKIKDETEELKQQKIKEAQQDLEKKKAAVQAEKAQMLAQIKEELREQKDQMAQQDLNQVFDYINMDDGFDNDGNGPGPTFG